MFITASESYNINLITLICKFDKLVKILALNFKIVCAIHVRFKKLCYKIFQLMSVFLWFFFCYIEEDTCTFICYIEEDTCTFIGL